MRTTLAILFTALLALAGEPATEGVGLTIYSSPGAPRPRPNVWNPRTQRWEQPEPGFAIVKERRKIALAEGLQTIRFQDVAARIDATTVHFLSLTDAAGTSVLEQNFEFDLVSAEKVLAKFLDREVGIVLEKEQLKGTLLSSDGGQIVLRTADPASPIRILSRAEAKQLLLPELPGGLITRPTLVWNLHAGKAGEQLCKVTYQTGGMRWNADYTLVIAPDDASLDLAGWVTIHNQSGGSFRDAELKLVAGDVHRAEESEEQTERFKRRAEAKSAAADTGGFEEKAFFEYHLYTLGRKTTLPDNSIKQIELFPPTQGVPARKIFVYYGGAGMWTYGGSPFFDRDFGISSNKKVDIWLEYRNGKEQNLGMPLPAGKVRVYKRDDADGSLEMVGEDRIDHTPKDEKVKLQLGSAFDIVGERKQTEFRMDERAHWIRESFEVRIRNHKPEEVEVIVKENLYRWSNWEVQKPSHEFTKEDARTIHFPVKVPADGETVITYSVQYTW
jgi:hypothetical protein